MKNRYQSMTKKEQEKVREAYKKTDAGKAMMTILNRLAIIGALGLIVAIFLIVYTYVTEDYFWNYITSSLLFIASVVFIVMSVRLRAKEYNKHTLKEEKKPAKEKPKTKPKATAKPKAKKKS